MQDLDARTRDNRSTLERVWRFPLVAMIVGILCFGVATGIALPISQFLIPKIPGLSKALVFDIISVPLLVLVMKYGIARLGEQPRDDLRSDGAWRWLGWGLLGGLVVFSAAVIVAALLGVYRIIGVGNLNGLLPALIGSAIFPAISEEMLFRGVLFRWLEEFGGSWVALLLTSCFFGAAHLANPHASPIAAIGIAFEAGVMLGAAYMLSRSLWMPMGLHAAWNFTQGEIYDIPVSGLDSDGLVRAKLTGNPLLTGNGFGLEASVIAMTIATVFGLWLLRLAIRRGQLIAPWWVRRRRRGTLSEPSQALPE